MFRYLVLIILSVLNFSCSGGKTSGAGVLIDTANPPPNQNPNSPETRSPIGDKVYSNQDIISIIEKHNDGDVIVLDGTLNLDAPIVIDKEIIIAAPPGKRNRINSGRSGELFYIFSDNVVIKDADVYLKGSSGFVHSGIDEYNPGGFKNLTIEGLRVFLEDESSFRITMDGVIVKNCTIFGLARERKSSLPMIKVISSSSKFLGNLVVDLKNNHGLSMLIINSSNIEVFNNIFKSYSDGYTGALTITSTQGVKLRNNVIYDVNRNRINGSDANLNGSIGVSIQSSSSILDEFFPNFYNAQNPIISEEDFNQSGSSNVFLNFKVPHGNFTNDQLVVSVADKDYRPLCDVINNVSLKTISVDNWKHKTFGSSSIYFAGALPPACGN